MTDLRVALDVGTTAIKAAAFDAEGRLLVEALRPSDVLRGIDGTAEQDPLAVWEGACACFTELMGSLKADQLSSLGICAQGDGLWPLDATGQPVGNAILWSDTRQAIAEDLAALAKTDALAAVGRGCNTALWPGTSAMGWRWLRCHAPDRAVNVAHIVTCGDWIARQLTGALATDFSNATIPFLDLATRRYGDAAQALDCADALGLLCPPRQAGTLLGRVTAQAAAQTGLPEGLPVSVATLDLSAMLVGLGLAQPGETMMILGTTAVVNILTDRATPNSRPIAATVLHPTREVMIRVLAPSTGAAAFDWFASLHPLSLGGDGAEEIAAKLNRLVKVVPIGSNGVTFLPYLNGERAPFVAPDLRASFAGMSAATTKGELGRAVMEGTALSLRHCFEAEGGLPSQPVQLTGGGARNPVWCQIIADVIGQDVLVNPASDLGLWGAACLGAAAVSGADPIHLARRSTDPVQIYASSARAHAAYGPVFERYLALSNAIRSATAGRKGPCQ